MKFETILGKLVASSTDIEGYTTYVFEDLDHVPTKFYMMVRYPNWDTPPVTLGSIGYVKFSEVQAGIDQWYDGKAMNKYRYDDIIFYKFIDKPQEHTNELFL